MKFNLKNRPECPIKEPHSPCVVEEWFEGFEKELREWIDAKPVYEGSVAFRKIREILGE